MTWYTTTKIYTHTELTDMYLIWSKRRINCFTDSVSKCSHKFGITNGLVVLTCPTGFSWGALTCNKILMLILFKDDTRGLKAISDREWDRQQHGLLSKCAEHALQDSLRETLHLGDKINVCNAWEWRNLSCGQWLWIEVCCKDAAAKSDCGQL